MVPRWNAGADDDAMSYDGSIQQSRFPPLRLLLSRLHCQVARR